MAITHDLANAQKDLLRRRQAKGVDYRPTSPKVERVDLPRRPAPDAKPKPRLLPDAVKIYPTLAVAALDRDLAPAFRVYLLMRALDGPGEGRLAVAYIRELLTGNRAELRIVGRRQLRNILSDGKGIFWDRYTADHVWLRSAARIAEALDCGRLRGRPVLLPLELIAGKLEDFKAALFNSWHAGRAGRDGSGSPISQAKVRDLTGIPESTQRRYCDLAGVKRQRQIAVSDIPYTIDNAREVMTWRGHSVFRFKDFNGKLGKRGRATVAWCLPSIYMSDLSQTTKGRQRKHNRLIDLVTNGARGNDRHEVVRIYHPKAAAAAAAYNRDPDHDHYWHEGGGGIPDASKPPKLRGVGVWRVLKAT